MFHNDIARAKAIVDLDQQAFLRKIRENLLELEVEVENSDQTLIKQEAEMQVLQEEKKKCEAQGKTLAKTISQQEDHLEAAKKQHETLVSQKSLLLDFEGLLRADFQPRFFTQKFSDFALEKDIGEMTLQKIVDQSTDGLSITVKGSSYWYVKVPNGEYWFHPFVIPTDPAL